jgi:nitrite reductase (NO-forming)
MGRRLVALNVAVLAVLAGVTTGLGPLTATAAALLVTVVGWQLGALVHAGAKRAENRFAGAVRFYWVAAAALLAGIGAGVTLAVGDLPPGWQARVYAAHVQLNVFGWVALSVLGTLFALWPMALRTRVDDQTLPASRWALPACTAGLVLECTGALAARAELMEAGIAGYGCGVAVCLMPLLQTARRRWPRSPASWMLAAGTCWLLAATGLELTAVLRAADAMSAAGQVHEVVPWLLAGFVAQVLLGALTYLLPTVLGGGPAAAKRTAALLDRAGPPRTVALNIGIVLLAVPTSQSATISGWALVGAAIATTTGLCALAVARRGRPTGR